MRTAIGLQQRWRAYWRGVVMGAAIAAGQIGPMGDPIAAERDAITIVRMMHDGRTFDPREQVGGLILTRVMDLSDRKAREERSGGSLN